jgi:uncharacterized RDD family membrane protein YckC
MKSSDFEYVGFWPRVGASIIDSIILVPILGLLLWMVYGASYFDDANEEHYAGPMELVIMYVLPAIGSIVLWLKILATPGKMAINAKIVDAKTGEPMGTAQAIIRYLCYYVSMLPLFLGFIWIAFDSKKQGWHDKIAGTVVVRTK